jgi:hypothetical protein
MLIKVSLGNFGIEFPTCVKAEMEKEIYGEGIELLGGWMRKYKFKRGFKPTKERLEEQITLHFGEFEKDGEIYIVRYGAIEELRLWFDGKLLCVESKTNPRVDPETASQTLKTYNRFLEELTGYTAKERQKMMKKEIEG